MTRTESWNEQGAQGSGVEGDAPGAEGDAWDRLAGIAAAEATHPWSFTVMARNLVQTADSALILSAAGAVPPEVLEVAPEDSRSLSASAGAHELAEALREHEGPYDVVVAWHTAHRAAEYARLLMPGGVLLLERLDDPAAPKEGQAVGECVDLVDLQRELVQAGFTVERADTHRQAEGEGALRVVVIARTPEAADAGRTDMRSLLWDPSPEVPEV